MPADTLEKEMQPRHSSTALLLLVVAIGGALTLGGCHKAAPPPPPVMVKRSAVDQRKLEPLYRVAKTMQASQAVGVNYQKFGELMQAFATEISIAKDKASSPREEQLVAAYSAALLTLHDSSTLWKEQIDDARYDFIPAGQIFVEGSIEPLATKYNLEKTTHKGYGKPWQSISASAIQLIWSRASDQIDSANKLYYEEELVPQATPTGAP